MVPMPNHPPCVSAPADYPPCVSVKADCPPQKGQKRNKKLGRIRVDTRVKPLGIEPPTCILTPERELLDTWTNQSVSTPSSAFRRVIEGIRNGEPFLYGHPGPLWRNRKGPSGDPGAATAHRRGA